MFRWGILSTARIAREHVLVAFADSHNGFIAAIASRNGNQARALADRFNASLSFDNYQALLECDQIDGVYIPLPTEQHLEWSLRAAAAGKHVLCEKPICLRGRDVDKLIEARDRYGILISEAFMVYYHPQWHKVRALLSAGAIGDLRHVSGVFTYHNVDPKNIRNRVELGGGALLDIGVYPLVTTRLVTGLEPLAVNAQIKRSAIFGTDVFANIWLYFKGFNLNFYCSTEMSLRQSMVFHGTLGCIELTAPFNAGDYDFARIIVSNQDISAVKIYNFADVHQYKLQAEAFVNATCDDSDVFSLENSRDNLRALDMIFAAAAGKVRKLPGKGKYL